MMQRFKDGERVSYVCSASTTSVRLYLILWNIQSLSKSKTEKRMRIVSHLDQIEI